MLSRHYAQKILVESTNDRILQLTHSMHLANPSSDTRQAVKSARRIPVLSFIGNRTFQSPINFFDPGKSKSHKIFQ